MEVWVLSLFTYLAGYYMGNRHLKKDIHQGVEVLKDTISDILKDKPKPGVVRRLTEEEIEEKHDPTKKGNKESFDRLFKDHPPLKL